MAAQGKQFILAKKFEGDIKDSDFRLEDTKLGAIKDGEVLLEALYLSVDPYMRVWPTLTAGDVMIGEQVARVIESKCPDVPVGSTVQAMTGWTTRSIAKGSDVVKVPEYPADWPKSLALGTLGMPGMTAYFGVLEHIGPKKGDTFLVSGAAGAVGAVVGQLAKIKGCTVIGFAGSEQKVKYLKEIGYDVALNYKTIKDLDKTIKEAAPNGVDCYFDNVGGEMSSTVIRNMNDFGRVCVCGSISSYNSKELPKATIIQPAVNLHRLKIQGMLVYDSKDKFPAAVQQMITWVKEGKLKYKEHVTTGFENAPKALQELFTGSNFGKAIVKI